MLRSVTNLTTPNASRYLQQVCKHFAHKLPVTFDPSQGECRFEMGTAHLTAAENTLRIAVDASDEAQLARMQQVMESHLLRFAFREELGPLSWETQQ